MPKADKPYENPLTPNARLREMYEVMVAARLLARRSGTGSLGRGLEACWVGTGIGLRDFAADLLSAGTAGPVLDAIAGVPWKQALAGHRWERRMELAGTAPERVAFALGLAAGGSQPRAVLIYVRPAELTAAQWKRLLAEALRLNAPAVFVALPGKTQMPDLADLALRAGVAGIPVDAADAIALYRVAQECTGRARAGGGPALIAPVVLAGSADPLDVLCGQLIGRRVATERWVAAVTDRFRTRLKLPA